MEKDNSNHQNTSLLQLLAARVIALILIILLNDPFGMVTGVINALK